MMDAATPDELRVGSRVGPWRIEARAGRGTYGAVYRARREGEAGGLPVALKIARFPQEPRFVREAGLLSRFQHPAIPRLIDVGEWRSGAGTTHPFLVMEWIEGQPLYEWGRGHGPTCRQVLRAVAQVAEALALMHQRGCLHRDVKGDNILIEPTGRARLLDYGAGTWAGAPPLTDSLLPPGTHEYRSPEALRFHWTHLPGKGTRYEALPADDVYALGVSTYWLVTRLYPPPGTAPEEAKAWAQEPVPTRASPRELNSRVAPELEALIERMLAMEPGERATAREVARVAEAAAKRGRAVMDVPLWGSNPPDEATQVPSVPVRRWRPGVAVAWGLVLMGGAWCLSSWPRLELPLATWERATGPEEAPDAGTQGLGSVMAEAPVQSEEATQASAAVTMELPKEPLPGQRRAPCRRQGEVEIRGGCWGLAKTEPPCGEVAYEWQGACYHPMIDRTRKPTTDTQR